MIQVALKSVSVTLHQLRIRKIIINPQLGELTWSMLNNIVLLHQTRSLKILANVGWNKGECLAKSLFLLVAMFASTKAFSAGWTENWLGHIGDWAYMYVSHPDYDNRCVGKRTSGSMHYELSLSENSSNWGLRISGIDSYPIFPSGHFRLHLALDGKGVTVIDATGEADNSLIATDLPEQLIKSLAASNRLSVQLENQLLGDFTLKRIGRLIDTLADCQRNRGKPNASSNESLEFQQEKVQLHFMKLQQKELKEKGRYPQAIEISRKIIELQESARNIDQLDITTSMNNLAVLYVLNGQYAEAETAYKDVLDLEKNALGTDHPAIAITLYNFAGLYRKQGRHTEAENLYKRSLHIMEQALGSADAELARPLNGLALLYADLGRYAESESLYSKALTLIEKSHGSENPDYVTILSNLATLYMSQGYYAEAEPLLKKTLTLEEQSLGSEHPKVATSLHNLASLYLSQGRYSEVEPLLDRALVIKMLAFGADHPDIATALDYFGAVYRVQGRYDEAESVLKRALSLRENALGPTHTDLAITINRLGSLYEDQARYAEAEQSYVRALELREKGFGSDHPDVAASFNNLALFYSHEGRYEKAERMFKKALIHSERSLGNNHPDVATVLDNLGSLYETQGRYADAEPLLQKALDMRAEVLGPAHPSVATSLSNLALLYQSQGRYLEAEPLHKESLALREEVFGPEHRAVSSSQNNLALLYASQERYAEAESLYERALAQKEKALGREHPATATGLNNLANLYDSQRRYGEAELLYGRALALMEKARGSQHPDVAHVATNLALLYRKQDKPQLEQPLRRRVQQIDVTRLTQGLGGKEGEGVTEQRGHALSYLYLLARLQESDIEDRADALVAVQLARRTERGNAFRFLAQRLAAGGTGDLASLVRQRQDLIQRLGALEKSLVDSYALPAQEQPEGLAERLRTQIDELSQQERTLSDRLRREFPAYAEFEGSRLADLSSLQQALQPGEAAVVWVLGKEESYRLIVAHAGDVQLKRLPVTQAQVADQVEQLHRALNLADPEHHGELAAFPAAVAADLFNQLFGAEWASDFDGIERLLLVPEGPLTRLAFPALLTAHKQQPTFSPVDPAYKDAPWLARRFAVSVLPSLSALTVLREDRLVPTPSEPFLGVGDPLLNEHPAKTRGIQASAADQVFSVRAVSSATQIQPVDVSPAVLRNLRLERIRQQPSLPDTAEELQRIAELLGAKDDALLLREAATEQRVKQSPLDRYGVLSFATHGVLAGELGKGIEPGLILTPPAEATEVDDGFLSLSEVAELELNADWVVLSACNTAAPETGPDSRTDASAAAGGVAEGLTGLAKAFTYAGAKALLVSHWAVASKPNVELMETIFRGYRDKQLSRAEAHRQAMLKMLEADDPLYRHPSIWAPFVLVGDGG